MPNYLYVCPSCEWRCYEIRRIKDRNAPRKCNNCGEACERILEAPACNPWDEDRKFPNLSPRGDGTKTFKSQTDYEVFLKENHIGEIGVNAPKLHPSGRRVVMTDGRK